MGELDRLLANEPAISQAPPPARPQTELQRLLSGVTTVIPDTQTVLKQGSAEDIQVPDDGILRRPAGARRQEFLSQEGSPTQPYYKHLPEEVAPPTPSFTPSNIKLFKEDRRDLPVSELKRLLEQGVNATVDVTKNLAGAFTDPEALLGGGLMGRYLKGQRAVTAAREQAKTAPPVMSMPRATTGEPGPGTHHEVLRLPPPQATARPLPPSAQHALEPRPLGPGSHGPGTGGPGGGGPRLPIPLEPPDPPERLAPDGTYRYEPWRPNYDVFVSDWKDPNINWWESFKRKLPADYNIATKNPESPVIGILDRPATELMNWTDEFVRSPEMKELSKLDADLFVVEEAKAYEVWEQMRRARTTPQIAPSSPSQVGPTILGPGNVIDDVRYNPLEFDEIMRMIDPKVRPWFELFHERMKVDQRSRTILGLDKIDEVPYPYLPRIGHENWERIMTLYRGDRQAEAVSQLSTTLKGFQEARSVPTYSAGFQKGFEYEDPKRAIIMRYVLSKQLEFTANMMQELKGTVLFDTRLDATGELLRRRNVNRPVTPTADVIADPTHTRDVAHPAQATRLSAPATPLQNPVAVRGLPGPQGKVYWVPSKDEALSLHQHLSGHQATWGMASAVFNQLFRNPNLFNPAPHVIKNMGYKYVIAATGLSRNPVAALKDLAGYSLRMPFDFAGKQPPLVIGRLAKDADEYAKGLNPLLKARYEAVMPFSKTAQTAYENLKPYLETNKTIANTQLIAKYLTGNAWSSKYIFSKADPAMKYSLWKMYLEKGMSDVAAANQVNVDLVRYTLRSELVDTWKGVPLNFFVPWRTGTVMATAKQLSTQPWTTLAMQQGTKVPLWAMTRPFKTSLLIGAWMLGREAYFRETGYTHHLPIDYVNGPTAQIVANPLTMPYVAASMYLLGAGGDPKRIAGDLKDIFGILKGDEDKAKLMEMYWGIAQIYGGGQQFLRFAQSLDKHGVAGADYDALAHVLMSAALAEYESYGYKPKHLEHLIPKELLPYNPAVEKNIEDNRKRAEAMAARAPRRDARRAGKQKAQHERVHPTEEQ